MRPCRSNRQQSEGREKSPSGEVGVLLLTTDGSQVVQANEAASELLGYTSAELRALPPGHLLAGPQPSDTWRVDNEIAVLLRADGSRVACHVGVGRLELPEGDRLIATLRPRTEPAGQERIEALLRIAIEQLPEAMVIYDTDDRLLYYNRAYCTFFPYMPPFEVLDGCHFFDVIRFSMAAPGVIRDPLAQSDPEAYLQKRLKRLHEAAGVPFEQETAGRWHLVHEQRVPGVGFVSLRHDITEMKQLHNEMAEANRKLAEARETAEIARQRAEEANRSKSEFLAMMSHELRTPLNAILGFSSLLADEHLGPLGSEKYRDYGRSIHDSGAHLLSIINDILDLAKVEAGKMEIVPESLNVKDLVEECVSLVAGLAQGRGLGVETSLPNDGLMLMADRRAAKQMIVNLLSNACKFTKAGGSVRLCAVLLEDAKPPGGVAIRVSDTGIGMTPEDIAVAVQPFGQIGSVATSGRQGTGLGLPLVKSFIELHGGSLKIESEPGKGTDVELVFPG